VDGLPYSASVAAFSAQDGLDKPLMVRYGWGVDAGYYAAAYRIPSLAFMPVQAMIVATLNRTFIAGRAGVGSALSLAKRLLIPALAYSIAVALVIATCAPLFEPLLGDSFKGAIPIVRWLAFLPVLRTLQYFPANALMGAGRQRLRLGLLLVTLAVNLVLCFVLIPHWSWRGALVATFVGETVYAVLLWAAALRLAANERRGKPRLSSVGVRA
jgi:O-antigen/teichoic acid export membrane protein